MDLSLSSQRAPATGQVVGPSDDRSTTGTDFAMLRRRAHEWILDQLGYRTRGALLQHLLARLHHLLPHSLLMLAHHLLKRDWILRHGSLRDKSSRRGHW